MKPKGEQLQIRVSADEKAKVRQLAKRAGLDVSSYVLRRALVPNPEELPAILRGLGNSEGRSFALAALADMLVRLSSGELAATLDRIDVRELPDFTRNYVAALVEEECTRRRMPPPAWVHDVQPLCDPWFAAPFRSLRAHLIRHSPVAFRRRNLFVDNNGRV